MKQLKKAIYIISALLFSGAFCACNKSTTVENHLLIIAEQDSLYGIWDITENDWLIPNKYEDLLSFTEGLAAFKKQGKWGFVDTTGKEVIPAMYEYLHGEGFIKGTAFIKSNGKWGMIDKSGKEILSPRFDAVRPYGEGYYTVILDEKENLISTDGKLFLPDWYTSVNRFCEGYASAETRISGDDAVGCIIDKKGRMNWHDSLFRNIYPFSGGTSMAILRNGFRNSIIDTSGKIIFAAAHNWIRIRKTGNDKRMYTVVTTTLNGSEKCGLFDPSGKMVLDTVYDELSDINEGLISFKKGDKWGVADSTGEIIVPGTFDDLTAFNEGYAIAYEKEKQGFIDKTGKWVIAPTFDDVNRFYNGLALVSIGDKEGVIDKNGKWVIPCEYHFLNYSVINGCLSFAKDGRTGIIDISGKELVKSRFDRVTTAAMKMKTGTMLN